MNILRLLTIYNEKDIIRDNIEYYAEQGIETVVLDNYSKDGTYEILKEYEGKGIRWIERYKTEYFRIIELNTILVKLALKERENYFIWLDADEFLCPFDFKYPLKELIKFLFEIFVNVDAFNAGKVEFYHTSDKNLDNWAFNKEKLKYFYYEPKWKDVIFKKRNDLKSYLDRPYYIDEGNKEIKYKKLNYLFFIKHYPFRSIRQAKKKIYRAVPKNIKKVSNKIVNWHLAYIKDDIEKHIIKDKNELNKFINALDFFKSFAQFKNPSLKNFYQKIEQRLSLFFYL